MELCFTEGGYTSRDEIYLKGENLTYIFNGVHYRTHGLWKRDACSIALYNNKHLIEDIADPKGWDDWPLWYGWYWGSVAFGGAIQFMQPFAIDIRFDSRPITFVPNGFEMVPITSEWPFD